MERKQSAYGGADGRTDARRTDRHTDGQRESISPRHLHVVGYKKEILYS